MTVALTGARGTIGRVLLDWLAERHTLIPVTRREALPGGRVADLTDPDALERAFAGCEGVIHLAGEATVEAAWHQVLDANIVGTFHVLEACRRAGVRRVVFASTSHVVGMFEVAADERLYDLDDGRTIDHRSELRPDSLYGVSKAFGEALCRLYVERHGLECVCLRIGTVLAAPDPVPGHEEVGPWTGWSAAAQRRLRATWLSHRDCAELFDRALVAACRWALVFGTSANHRRLWDLEHAREAIGYEPRDAAPRWLGDAAPQGGSRLS